MAWPAHRGGSAQAGVAGTAGGLVEPSFMLGADISSLPEAVDAGTTFVDTDGVSKGLLELLRGHGFNYVRLRTFVDPMALYGYANPTGEAQYRKSESYCDEAHTLELAQQIKRVGMGFLLDLHYSDNWADPGKQVIPEAWRAAASIEELAAHVQRYTSQVVSALVDGGARPDLVQIGNEITPGLLIHVPAASPEPDQWGNINKVRNGVNGSIANMDNVARLLEAGVTGVKAVDPSIRVGADTAAPSAVATGLRAGVARAPTTRLTWQAADTLTRAAAAGGRAGASLGRLKDALVVAGLDLVTEALRFALRASAAGFGVGQAGRGVSTARREHRPAAAVFRALFDDSFGASGLQRVSSGAHAPSLHRKSQVVSWTNTPPTHFCSGRLPLHCSTPSVQASTQLSPSQTTGHSCSVVQAPSTHFWTAPS